MNDWPRFLLLLLMLVLPLTALVARRSPLGATMKLALIWILIFAGAAVVAVEVRSLTGELRAGQRQAERLYASHFGGGRWSFRVDAVMDDVTTRMLIDSGATMTALSLGTAKAADVDWNAQGFTNFLT